MTKNQYYKTLPKKSFQQVKPNDYFSAIKREAAVKEHNRKQTIEDAKMEAVAFCIRNYPKIIIFLLLGWVVCAYFNASEIKNGIELVSGFLVSLFFGSLIGKYIV